jgi:hypothetical protein
MQDKTQTMLTEQDAVLLEQGASMLEDLESEERKRGNCSKALGAGCSAHAVRRLASALLAHEREIGQCLHQITEPQAVPAAVAVRDEREAFVNWLHGAYPHSYTIIEAAHLWFHKHVAALAWQARAALAATPAAAAPVQRAHIAGALAFFKRAIDCKEFNWDSFQRESAEASLQAALNALSAINECDTPNYCRSVQRCTAMDEQLAASEPVVLPEPDALELIKGLVRTESEKARLHQEYFGKPMPALTYDRFQRLRDERIPALWTQLSALLAGVSAPAQAATAPTAQDSCCAWSVWWTHDKAKHTTTRQASMAAWDAGIAYALARSAPQAQAQADARDADGMYYLQDARWSAMVGNCPSFWRLGGGYTTSLDDAERFTLEAAMKQHKCRETDLPWLCSELDKLRRPTVDCQYMPGSWDEQRAAIAAQAAKGDSNASH